MKRTLKYLFLSLAFLVLICAGSVHAASKWWKGPGWYVGYINIFDVEIQAGPYASEAACNANRPAPRYKAESFFCEYIEEDEE